MKTQDFMYEMQNTSAVFGRHGKCRVVFSGKQAYTDGDTINLPALPHGVTLTNEQVRIMRGYVDHEAGHLRHTDWNDAKKFFDQCKKDNMPLLKDVANVVEDIRIEDRVMQEYSGSKKNLSATAENIYKNYVDAIASGEMDLSNEALQVITALQIMGREDYAGEYSDKLMDILPEKIKEVASEFARMSRECETTQDAINLAKKIYEYINQFEDKTQQEQELPGNGDGEGTQAPDLDMDNLGDEPSRRSNSERDWSDSDQRDLVKASKSGSTKNIPKDAMPTRSQGRIKDSPEEDINGWPNLPEWKGDHNANYKVFSTERDEVFSRKSVNKRSCPRKEQFESVDPTPYNEKLGEMQSHVHVMKARLQRVLASKEARDWDAARQMGRLDSKRLTAAYNRSPSVYKVRKDREELDTAVHLMIDLSGSMHGQKAIMATKSVIAFAECLEGSPISYQISGFYNGRDVPGDHSGMYHRYEELNLFVFKGWRDRLHDVKPIVGSIEEFVGGNNSDQCAIEWAYQELRVQPNKRKVLMVFSDGHPACHTDYGRDSLVKNLRARIEELQKTNVECIGVGIHSEAVEEIYPRHALVTDLNDLSGVVFKQLSDVLLKGKVSL